MLEQLLNTGNCICGLSNAASSTVAKHVLTSGFTDEAASFIFYCFETLEMSSFKNWCLLV
jgi:hypothetical protein